jgi:hypothetical protein
MSKNLKRVITELDEGFVPFELSYGLDESVKVKFNWSSLIYNDYNRVDYWLDKLPDGLLEQFPCLESYYLEWAEGCINKTPLQELEERSCLKELINLENLKI